jgi:hypothetical protein
MASSTTNANTSLLVTNSAARLRYFLGQLLTQRDLSAEQQYHVMLRRLLQREVLGTGTVAGLEVTRTSGTPEQFVVVSAGFALDPDGRELLVESDVLLGVADPAATPGTVPFPPSGPESAATLATDIRTRFALPNEVVFAEQNVNNLITRLGPPVDFIAAGDPNAVSTLRAEVAKITATPPNPFTGSFEDWLFGQIVGVTHIGLQYREDGTEPSPTIADASCCAGVTCFPARTQEGVLILTSPDPFPAIADPHADFFACLQGLPDNQGAIDCDALRVRLGECIFAAWRGVPNVAPVCGDAVFPILPLAVAYWTRFPRSAGRFTNIDNASERLLALGVPMLRALTEVLAGCTTGGA